MEHHWLGTIDRVPLIAASGMAGLTNLFGNSIYFVQALVAIWGTYCLVMVWMRIRQKRFDSESEQQKWLAAMEPHLKQGDLDGARQLVSEDIRAVPQLLRLALDHPELSPASLQRLVADRFRRDVLADMDHRLSWVNTVIKSAPMLGLLGTVAGMMGAFGQLATAENVRPDELAQNISLALITTLVGLTIAIPLMIGMNSVQIRISKLEDLVESGVRSFFELLPDRSRWSGK